MRTSRVAESLDVVPRAYVAEPTTTVDSCVISQGFRFSTASLGSSIRYAPQLEDAGRPECERVLQHLANRFVAS